MSRGLPAKDQLNFVRNNIFFPFFIKNYIKIYSRIRTSKFKNSTSKFTFLFQGLKFTIIFFDCRVINGLIYFVHKIYSIWLPVVKNIFESSNHNIILSRFHAAYMNKALCWAQHHTTSASQRPPPVWWQQTHNIIGQSTFCSHIYIYGMLGYL